MDDEERAFRIEAWGGPVPHGADTWAVEAPSACEEVVVQEDVSHSTQHDHQTYMVGGDMHHSMSTSLDQMAAENLIFMAHDGMEAHDPSEEVELPNDSSYNEEQYFECQVTEEVITDDWVQEQGVERLELEMYHIKLALKLILKKPKVEIVADQLNQKSILGNDCMDDEVEVPLPTDQDEYTASRPYPCDFCSRRFRKKANLMNHMVAHQVDRPHGCNLCGARYIRKCDLMNHLKIHAYAPEQDDQQDDMEDLRDLDGILGPSESPRVSKMGQRKRKTATKRKKQREQPEHESQVKYALQAQPYEYVDEDMRLLTEAAEQHYASMNALAAEPRYPVTDSRKPFVCQHCGVGFAREKALASHARVHGGDSPFECETCGEMFWDAALLREHTRTKHQERSSNSEYEPENDESEMSDSDGKFGDYYCNTCGMSFHRVDLLRRHARLHVKKEIGDMEDVDGHVCNVCGKVFQEALDLLAHAEVHARYQPHRCMLCGETFSDEQSVTVHVTANHADMLSANSCMLCGKECRDRRSLLKHSWDHSKEREHSCSKCCKTFHNKARLKRHMVSHRNKSVSCDICGEEFPDGRSLMNHRHSHSSMSGRQFPCRECGKTFGSRSSQQIHIRIHTGERPYGCRFCWKAFADGGTLRKHERIHTGEKPYACAVCPRAFNQRVVLREHIRSHHSGPDGKRGTVEMPFCCAVCSDLFESSAELIQHLIQHSDMNTAMKRQPQVGPRKYKRRRKLKPHEMERLTRHSYDKKERAQDSDHDSDHYSVRSQERELELEPEPVRPAPAPKMKATKKTKKQLQKASMEEGYESVFKSFANALQNINSIVNNTKPPKVKKKKEIPVQARPKMIHTSKTRVAVDNPSDGKKKTKTLITRTTPSESNAHIYRGTVSGERNRPRTKNVSYHVLAPEKHAPAVFPDAQLQSDLESILAMATPMRIIKSEPNEMVVAANEVIMDTELENSLKEVRGMEKYNSDLVNDLEQILQSPIRTKVNSESNSVTVLDSNLMPPPVVEGIAAPSPVNITMIATEADKITLPPPNKIETRNRGVPKKSFKFIRHVKSPIGQSGGVKKSNALIHPENIKTEIMIKEELLDPLGYEGMDQVYKCEMCSESFGTRSALLVHVPIHIIC